MSFQQGLSGLNAASKSLEVTGNNVANASTVGFKGAQAQFADVYANSLNGSGSTQIGIGTKISTVAQQFTQGNVTASNNPLDLAINGAGFFRLSTNGTVTYGRNGQFQLDKNGFVVTAQGARLTGYAADSKGVLSTGAPTDLNINTSDLPPQPTKLVNLLVNLDSREDVPATAVFSATDPTSYNRSTSISVFDTLGNSHVLQTYFVKTPPIAPSTISTNTWSVYGTSDGVPLANPVLPATTPPTTTSLLGSLQFGTDGVLLPNTSTPPAPAATTPQPFLASATVISGATNTLDFNIDFTGTTQFGANFGLNTQTQDGYTSGKLSGFATGADGTITGRYTNGKSATLGQVVLSNFVNPNGLQALGNNAWAETAASGQPLTGTPTSGSLGLLQSSAVEDSNVDLTAELVNMITAQRFYQANAQTIKTQDQILQTLVNLR